MLADLFKGILAAVAQAVPHPQDQGLPLGKGPQGGFDLLAEIDVDDRVGGRGEGLVFEQVAERPFAVLAERGLDGNGVLRAVHHLEDLVDGQVHPLGQVLGGRGLAVLLD